LGSLGLGFLKLKGTAKSLEAVAEALDAGPVPRAAAAFALGELGEAEAAQTLAEVAEASDPLIRAHATIALARLNATSAPNTIAQNLVSTNPELSRAATAGALVFSTGRYQIAGDPLDNARGQTQLSELLEQLVPTGYSAKEKAEALVKLAEPILNSAVTAAQSSPERAQAVLELLLARQGKPAFGPLTADLDTVPPQTAAAAEQVAERIASEAVAPFVMLAHHPMPDVRARSVRFLAWRPEPTAEKAVIDTLLDTDPSVQRAALEAVARANRSAPGAAIRRLLHPKYAWPVRAQAARTLGALPLTTQHGQTLDALRQSALNDDYALVREAAIEALHHVDKQKARAVLERASQHDPEAKVRETARKLLSGDKP
jgi:HEAT repeat protein